MTDDIPQYAWEWRNDNLFLPASGARPAMVVYWRSTRRWCWNPYDNSYLSTDLGKCDQFSSAPDAQRSAERWLRAHYESEVG